MSGLSTIGSISLGIALVAGRKRVPNPATGKTALRTGLCMKPLNACPRSSGAIYVPQRFVDQQASRTAIYSLPGINVSLPEPFPRDIQLRGEGPPNVYRRHNRKSAFSAYPPAPAGEERGVGDGRGDLRRAAPCRARHRALLAKSCPGAGRSGGPAALGGALSRFRPAGFVRLRPRGHRARSPRRARGRSASNAGRPRRRGAARRQLERSQNPVVAQPLALEASPHRPQSAAEIPLWSSSPRAAARGAFDDRGRSAAVEAPRQPRGRLSAARRARTPARRSRSRQPSSRAGQRLTQRVIAMGY